MDIQSVLQVGDGMNEETKSLIWHKGEPKKDGEYICKCVDAKAVYMDAGKVDWSEPYYGVYDFYKGLWRCDGAVIAWAEIPECSFELE